MRRKRDGIIIIILWIATALRMYRPGLWVTWGDELNMINAALAITQHGDWTWLGNEASFGALAAHSPFSVYVTALPTLISPHPLIIRLFYALLGVVTVAIMYGMMRRTVGFIAAVVAASLLAVMPLPVDWSRYVWNPNLAPIFILIWLVTAAEGYFKGRTRGQYIHWIALSCIVQAQTALVSLLPFSIVLAGYTLWQSKNRRQALVKHHMLILVIVGITFLPWAYGLYGYQQGWWSPPLGVGDFDAGRMEFTIPSPTHLVNTFSLLTASTHHWQGNLNISSDSHRWWFPDWGQFLLYGQALFTAVAAIVLIMRGIRTHYALSRFGLFLGFLTIAPLSFLIFDRTIPEFYMMPMTFAGIAVLAWGIQMMSKWSPVRERTPALPYISKNLSDSTQWLLVLPVILVAVQLWLTVSIIDWHTENPILSSYGDIIALVETWHDDEMEVLVSEYNADLSPIEQHKWRTHWQILSATYPIRYLTSPTAIPIAPNGQRLIGDVQDSGLRDFLGEGQVYEINERTFIAFNMHFDDFPQPSFVPSGSANFGDLARVIGVYKPPTQEMLYIYWQPQQHTQTTYQFSLRWLDDDGQILAQTDQTSLEASLWRPDDTVVTFINMDSAATRPDDDGHFELVLYGWPDGNIVPVIALDESQLGLIMTLQADSFE